MAVSASDLISLRAALIGIVDKLDPDDAAVVFSALSADGPFRQERVDCLSSVLEERGHVGTVDRRERYEKVLVKALEQALRRKDKLGWVTGLEIGQKWGELSEPTRAAITTMVVADREAGWDRRTDVSEAHKKWAIASVRDDVPGLLSCEGSWPDVVHVPSVVQ